MQTKQDADDTEAIRIPQNRLHELKKFFRTLKLNFHTKDRLFYELKNLQEESLHLGKNGNSISLVQDEYKKYQQILKWLEKIYPHSKKYKKDYAMKTLNESIWIVYESENSYVEAAEEGITNIQKSYDISLNTYDVFFAVSGMRLHKKTIWKYGKAIFVKPTNRNFIKLISSQMNTRIILDQLQNIDCYLQLKQVAADHSSAISLAKPVAQLHIAILNSFLVINGTSKYNEPFSFYGEVGERTHAYTLTHISGRCGWSRSLTFNLAGFNPHILKSSSFIRRFKSHRISSQLKLQKDSLYIKRIFPALKWIGKTTNLNSEDEVFLYYCLALEALIFDHANDGKVVETLRKRIYALIMETGNTLSKTISAYNSFSQLYEIRSAIVHRGGIEVEEEDLVDMRYLAIGCLYKLIYAKPFCNYKSTEQLEMWFKKYN